jgi:hypothetical protein
MTKEPEQTFFLETYSVETAPAFSLLWHATNIEHNNKPNPIRREKRSSCFGLISLREKW